MLCVLCLCYPLLITKKKIIQNNLCLSFLLSLLKHVIKFKVKQKKNYSFSFFVFIYIDVKFGFFFKIHIQLKSLNNILALYLSIYCCYFVLFILTIIKTMKKIIKALQYNLIKTLYSQRAYLYIFIYIY